MEMQKTDMCAKRKKSDDASAAIASKLLQGWVLLNDYCPQCLTPLVRNRERRVYCVGCSQWAITEMEAAAKVFENPVDRSLSCLNAAALIEPGIQNGDMGNEQQRMTASPPAQQVKPSNFATFTSNAVPQAGIGGPMKTNDGSQSNEEPGKMTSLVLSKVELPSNTGAVLSQTLSTLVQKIEEIAKLIAVTHEPLVIKQLLEIIEHCVRLIQQITTVSR